MSVKRKVTVPAGALSFTLVTLGRRTRRLLPLPRLRRGRTRRDRGRCGIGFGVGEPVVVRPVVAVRPEEVHARRGPAGTARSVGPTPCVDDHASGFGFPRSGLLADGLGPRRGLGHQPGGRGGDRPRSAGNCGMPDSLRVGKSAEPGCETYGPAASLTLPCRRGALRDAPPARRSSGTRPTGWRRWAPDRPWRPARWPRCRPWTGRRPVGTSHRQSVVAGGGHDLGVAHCDEGHWSVVMVFSLSVNA